MRFSLLGPLECRRDGQLVPIRAGKHRVVLATLLLRANRPVSVERLIDHLWGDSPVSTARATVHQYVMRLRQALPAPELIRTVADGYQLDVSPDGLDLIRFHALVRRADTLEAAGDPAAEARTLRDALSLWHGPPLADVPSPSLQGTEVPRLVEEHLLVVERRIDTDLRLGRAADLVAELRSLTAHHPLRERFWYQLITAQVRSGRKAEAVATYHAACRAIDEELGIAPGARLRDLFESTIAGSEDPAPAGSSRHPAPRQLPPALPNFVGRLDELTTAAEVLRDLRRAASSPAVVAMHGPGGIGKSAIAIQVAHEVRDAFPDGQLYVDLQGASAGLEPLPPVEVLGRLLRACDPDAGLPTNEAEVAGRYRTAVADRRMLIVLDNAATVEQILPLLPAGQHCAVIVTSRRHLTTLQGTHVRIDRLPADASIELLALLAGQDRIYHDPVAAGDLARSCGHSPLALRIAGARLAGRPDFSVGTLARRISAGTLRDLEIDDLSIRSCFDVSYAELVRAGTAERDATAARAFRLFALLPVPDASAAVLAALLGGSIDNAERSIDRLIGLHLVEVAGAAQRFRMHDLLRIYARELAQEHDPGPDQDAALRRVHEWYAAAARVAGGYINRSRWGKPGTAPIGLELDSAQGAVAWLDAELVNLVALAGQAAADPDALGAPMLRLVPIVAHTLQKRGRWHEVEILTDTAAGIARQLGDDNAEAQLLASQAASDWRAGRYDRAEHNVMRALRLRQGTGDRLAEGRALMSVGWLHHRMGRLDEAIDYFRRSLGLLDPRAHPAQVGIALHHLGDASFQAGDYQVAEESLERSLEIRRADNDLGGASITLVALGRTYAQRGRFDEALRLLTEGEQLCREVGNREDEWEALLIRSEILLRMGQPVAAEPVVEQALSLTEQLKNDHGQSAAYRQLSRMYAALGRATDAAAARNRSAFLAASLTTASDEVLEAFLADGPHRDAVR